MRFSLQSSDKVIEFHATEEEFHATEAYFILGVTKVKYSASGLCSNEKGKITLRINTKSLTAWEKMLVKMKLCVYKHSHIPNAVLRVTEYS
jgi:hypothetical protein